MYTKEGVKGASPTREVQLLIKKEVKVKEKVNPFKKRKYNPVVL